MNKKPLNVLLADDDAEDCKFFKDALQELMPTTQLTIVGDGDELMKLLNQKANELPDVLFLDINMPRKNGFDCLSEIKKSELLKALPVVMFSTSNSQEKINFTFKTGANVYIHKPNEFVQLVKVIHHAIQITTEKLFSNSNLKYILNA